MKPKVYGCRGNFFTVRYTEDYHYLYDAWFARFVENWNRKYDLGTWKGERIK